MCTWMNHLKMIKKCTTICAIFDKVAIKSIKEKTTVCTLIEHVQSMYTQIIFKNDLYTSCIDCLRLIATKSLDVQ